MERNKGWIKLYRSLLDSTLWKETTPQQKVVMITLLLSVNHKDTEWIQNGIQYTCRPGQFKTSLDAIASLCGKGVSVQNVRTSLRKMEEHGFLKSESTNAGRIITLLKWDCYQNQGYGADKSFNRR